MSGPPAGDDAIPLLARDADLVAADKPAGVAVIPGRGEAPAASLRSRLERQLGERLWVVHRLDRDVSGVLLLARSAAAHRDLSLLFERGAVAKRYWALVQGVVAAEAGEIDLPIATGGHAGRSRIDRARGKPSRTRWRVTARLPGRSVLEVEPLTGRSHQIRVHLAAIGHPLAIDRKYGGRAAIGPVGADRATLHALSLSVGTAGSGERRTFTSPLAADLAALAGWLGAAPEASSPGT